MKRIEKPNNENNHVKLAMDSMENQPRRYMIEYSMLILSLLSPYVLLISLDSAYAYCILSAPLCSLYLDLHSFDIAFLLSQWYMAICWIPYVLVGYVFKRAIKDGIDSWSRFVGKIIILTAVAVIMFLPSTIFPIGSVRYVPLPVTSVVTLAFSRRFVVEQKDEPW